MNRRDLFKAIPVACGVVGLLGGLRAEATTTTTTIRFHDGMTPGLLAASRDLLKLKVHYRLPAGGYAKRTVLLDTRTAYSDTLRKLNRVDSVFVRARHSR